MESLKPGLVPGATGSIGYVLVKRISEIEQSIRVVVWNPHSRRRLFSPPGSNGWQTAHSAPSEDLSQ